MSALLPLANFEFVDLPTPAKNLGKRPREAWLPLDKLRVDDSYQRPVDAGGRKTLRGIIENFSWNKFAPIVVAPRPGGLYAIVDDQHRAVACAMHGGIMDVPCHILSCTAEEEAGAFAAINGIVTRMHSQYLFRARIASGDAKAVAANEAAKAAGVTILAYPVAASLLKVGETLAGKTIEVELIRVGRTALVAALELITRTGSGNAGLVKANIIEAFCDVYSTHPKWLDAEAECRRVVHRTGVREIFTRAAQRQATDGGSIRGFIGAVLAETLAASLGDGGKTINPLEQARAKQAKDARQGRAIGGVAKASPATKAKQQNLARVQEAHRLSVQQNAKPSAPSRQKVDERALIEEHLKTKGVRKLDPGASGNYSNMLDWLRSTCKLEAAQIRVGGQMRFRVGTKKPVDLKGLYRLVNEERAKRKLQPLQVMA